MRLRPPLRCALVASLALLPDLAAADLAPDITPEEACEAREEGDACEVSNFDGEYDGTCKVRSCAGGGVCLTCVDPNDDEGPPEGGCACRSDRAGAGLGLLALAGLALLVLRRRAPAGR